MAIYCIVLVWVCIFTTFLNICTTYLKCFSPGRFGNQADHFLGSLAFAKALNRTLALPPWVEYRFGEPKSVQVPFSQYFKLEPLSEFHKVIPMEEFMDKIAPKVWPLADRTGVCCCWSKFCEFFKMTNHFSSFLLHGQRPGQ